MAEALNTPSRRGILSFLAAAPLVTLPAMPAMPAIPTMNAMFSGVSWRACVAEYHAAKAALDVAQAHSDAVRAECKAARRKLVVPPGMRSPLLFHGWLEMSVDEIREDMSVRRGGGHGRGPRHRALVEKDMEGVAEFKAEYERLWQPAIEAWEKLNVADDRFGEADRALREFKVRNLSELSEKMAIADEIEDSWLMEFATADAARLASGRLV